MIRDAFRERQKGDYEVYIQFSKEEVEQLFEDMKVFVTEIENHVLNDLS